MEENVVTGVVRETGLTFLITSIGVNLGKACVLGGRITFEAAVEVLVFTMLLLSDITYNMANCENVIDGHLIILAYLHLRDGCCSVVQGPQGEQSGHAISGGGVGGGGGRYWLEVCAELLVESALRPGGLVGEMMFAAT